MHMLKSNGLISFSKEVLNALSNAKKIDGSKGSIMKAPVVALESTVVTHGLPYPRNLECALKAENAVREASNGTVVPATIAFMDNQIKVGLTNEELKRLASGEAGVNAVKLSRRDIASFLGLQITSNENDKDQRNKMVGGTTVSSTMIIANMAGISIFATGGIGGVHRDAFVPLNLNSSSNRPTLDVSADLYELGRTPVFVVSAGIKSILDIPHSLELLESLGVTVASYKSEYFPNFYSTSSICKSPLVVNTIEEAAKIWEVNRSLDIQSGMLFAVPNPKPYLDASKLEQAISTSLKEAQEKGVTGKYVTPYMLKRVNELTGGKDVVDSNITLIENNAKVAAQVAKQFAYPTVVGPKYYSMTPDPKSTKKVYFIGGSSVDIIAAPKLKNQILVSASSNPGKVSITAGGVARNMAEACARMKRSSVQTVLITLIGNDVNGKFVQEYTEKAGVKVISESSSKSKSVTSTYIGLNDSNGHLKLGMFDAGIMESESSTSDILRSLEKEIKSDGAAYCLDANLNYDIMEKVVSFINTKNPSMILLEPVSVPKARRIAKLLPYFSIVTPNSIEVVAMAEELGFTGKDTTKAGKFVLKAMNGTKNEILKAVIIKLGKEGAMVVDNKSDTVTVLPAPEVEDNKIVNSNGCGDTMGGVIANQLSNGKDIVEAVRIGMKAAVLTLQCEEAVSSKISDNLN